MPPAVHRPLVVGATALVVVLALSTALAGLAPWFFLLACWIAGGVLLAPALGWIGATATVVAGSLFLAQWVMVLNAPTGLPLEATQVIVMTVPLVALAVIAVVRRAEAVVYPPVRVVDTLAAVVPAAASAVLLVVAGWLRGAAPVTWAMAGDAQFNTVLARLVARAEGVTDDNLEVISLAQGLMAMVHLPGRDGVPADDLLLHDIVRQSDLWLLMILASSVLGGAIAARLLRDAAAPLRVVMILGAALLPLTWQLTGYAISAGFYNVALAYLALELVVLFWLLTRPRPWVRLGVLLLLTTVLLGAWTPLAVIPVAFAVAAGVVALRRRPDALSLATAGFGALQLLVFGLVFVLPTFLESQSALSAPGGIVGLPRAVVVAVAAAVVGVALVQLLGRGRRNRGFVAAGLLFVAGTAAGVGFLVFQNRHLDDLWTYYPIKFAWIALEVMLLMIWVGIGLLIQDGAARRVVGLVLLGLVGVAAGGVAVVDPPRTGGLGYLPLAQIALEPPSAERTVDTLSDHAGERVAFSRYFGSDDAFLNQWQFQLSVLKDDDPIRSYAYRPVESAADFCEAAQAWGGEMTVITADPSWGMRLESACPEFLAVDVRPAPEG